MTKRWSEMTSYLNNGYEVMQNFDKFEKVIPRSIIIPSFMTIRSQMPELDRGLFCPRYKIGSQNTPYKLRLILGFFLERPREFPAQANLYSVLVSYIFSLRFEFSFEY